MGNIINLGKDIYQASLVFQAAHATCNKPLPGGGPSAHTSEQQDQQMFGIIENDGLRWPRRDGLKWPHLASVVVGVDVA